MMSETGRYILSMIAAALLCSIILRIASKSGKATPVIKLLCGIFMIYVAIAPWKSFHWDRFEWFSQRIMLDASGSVDAGTKASLEAMSDVIKQTVETYISNKADAMNASLQIQVIMNNDDIRIPEYIHLTGNISPYAKQRLTQYIAEEFGIPEDRQLWT